MKFGLKSLFDLKSLWKWEKSQKTLTDELRSAILWRDVDGVKRALTEGADPNAPVNARGRHALDYAIDWDTPLVIFEALLEAGADPQVPYVFQGNEIRLSEAAKWCKKSDDIVKRLEQAEQEAESKNGPRPLSQKKTVSCGLFPGLRL